MRAHGLRRRLSYAMNVCLEVYVDKIAGEERMEVRSPLGHQQLEKLKALVEAYGWHLAYEPVPSHLGEHYFLAILPDQPTKEDAA